MPELLNKTVIDLNCDVGEGMGNDTALMPFISSANIACGYHAGNNEIMNQTVNLAIHHGVTIGAHPSFADKENFGRLEMHMEASEIYKLVTEQIKILTEIANSKGVNLHHVKPHGALYNMAARSIEMSKTIAQAIKDFDKKLILVGLSGSYSISEAKKIGLKTANEVFADRTYQDDGSLTPRSESNALIENPANVIQQVLQMIKDEMVTTVSGKKIPIVAETVCIHGDGKNAIVLARLINEALQKEKIKICCIGNKSRDGNE